MNNINQYTILKNSINFNEHINVWFCDNQEGKLFEIITIEKNDSYQRILDRIIPLEVVPLVNRDIGGIQKILESGYSELNHCYYIVYEYIEGYDILDNCQSHASLHLNSGVAKNMEIRKQY